MKPISIVVLFFMAVQLRAAESTAPSQSNARPSDGKSSAYAVTKRDANLRVWERITGEGITNSYKELASGLHYLKNGEWVESKAEIEILPDGTARAIQGQHQAYFPGNIQDGVIEVVTPDGLHQKSRPMGLYYFDGTNSILIAGIKSSEGLVVGSNVVMYPDAFTDIKADLRYTYKKGSFEQDIILRQQPPSPNEFGLNPQTASLEVWTEFFDTADPVQTQNKAGAKTESGLTDKVLKFGKMMMVQGKAFALDVTNSPSTRTKGVTVYKSWEQVQGRRFLVESVPMKEMATELSKLPLTASVGSSSTSPDLALHKVSGTRLLPSVRPAQASTGKIQLAKADMPQNQSGVVLDYTEVSGTLSSEEFEGITWYISDYTYVEGDCGIDSGAILKFAEGSALYIYGDFYCSTTPGGTALFTSMNDNSPDAGDIIYGSTGSPSASSYDCALAVLGGAPSDIHDLKIRYANTGIVCNANLFNCQFINTYGPIWGLGGSITLGNILITGASYCFGGDSGTSFNATFVTAADVGSLVCGVPMDFYNSLFAGVYYFGSYGGDHNATSGSSSGIFQQYGSDNYYLTYNSSYRNIGTTAGIDSSFLNTIQGMTTYAPQDGNYLDTDTPDLGYHYPIEDSDSDGMSDAWEIAMFGNLNQTASGDYDGDGMTNLQEYQNHLNPTSQDSDGDGVIDQPFKVVITRPRGGVAVP